MNWKIAGGRAVLAVATGALLFAVGLAADPPAHQWPQFRGVNRDGTSAETGLLDRWPVGGPKEIWRRPLRVHADRGR